MAAGWSKELVDRIEVRRSSDGGRSMYEVRNEEEFRDRRRRSGVEVATLRRSVGIEVVSHLR